MAVATELVVPKDLPTLQEVARRAHLWSVAVFNTINNFPTFPPVTPYHPPVILHPTQSLEHLARDLHELTSDLVQFGLRRELVIPEHPKTLRELNDALHLASLEDLNAQPIGNLEVGGR